MGKHHTLYISTDPNNLAPIGIPGQGLFIGSPGPTIYGRGSGSIDATGLQIDMTSLQLDLTNQQIQLSG